VGFCILSCKTKRYLVISPGTENKVCLSRGEKFICGKPLILKFESGSLKSEDRYGANNLNIPGMASDYAEGEDKAVRKETYILKVNNRLSSITTEGEQFT